MWVEEMCSTWEQKFLAAVMWFAWFLSLIKQMEKYVQKEPPFSWALVYLQDTAVPTDLPWMCGMRYWYYLLLQQQNLSQLKQILCKIVSRNRDSRHSTHGSCYQEHYHHGY